MSETTTAPVTEAPTAEATPAAIEPTAAANTPANLGQRIGAYLIDLAVTVGIVMVISLVIGMISTTLGFFLSLTGYAYFIMRDALPFLDGQSIGKKALGLRAVTTDGKSLSGNWQPGLIRNAVLLIPFFPLIELIILITKKDTPDAMLRLGDQWAGTQVITNR